MYCPTFAVDIAEQPKALSSFAVLKRWRVASSRVMAKTLSEKGRFFIDVTVSPAEKQFLSFMYDVILKTKTGDLRGRTLPGANEWLYLTSGKDMTGLAILYDTSVEAIQSSQDLENFIREAFVRYKK